MSDQVKVKPTGLAKVAHIFKNMFRVFAIMCVVFGIMGFALNGYINMYYSDPANVAQASSSLDADMGIFKVLPFDSLKESGQFGMYFGLQLLCLAVTCIVLMYVFLTLKKMLMNIQETGAAFTPEQQGNAKKTYIILTVLLALFVGFLAALVGGLLLGGVYKLTKSKNEQ